MKELNEFLCLQSFAEESLCYYQSEKMGISKWVGSIVLIIVPGLEEKSDSSLLPPPSCFN
jgi:hypothetical protein